MVKELKYKSLISERQKSVTALFGVNQETGRKHDYFGTGFYIKFLGRVYIVTALHVARKMQKYNYCFHSVGGKSFPIQGGYVGCPVPKSDFAILGCFNECFGDNEISVEITEIQPHYQKLNDHCLVTGFPGVKILQIQITNEVSAYMNSLVSEIVGMSTDNKHIYFKYEKKLVIPPGMSGSPMWFILYDKYQKVNITKYLLSGIVTRWDAKTETITATNGQIFIKYIEKMINQFNLKFPRSDLDNIQP